jgi:hypothetical protein
MFDLSLIEPAKIIQNRVVTGEAPHVQKSPQSTVGSGQQAKKIYGNKPKG